VIPKENVVVKGESCYLYVILVTDTMLYLMNLLTLNDGCFMVPPYMRSFFRTKNGRHKIYKKNNTKTLVILFEIGKYNFDGFCVFFRINKHFM